MLYAMIVACEIGFWVALGVGLALRYVLQMPRASQCLLACAPLIDVVLLASSYMDLKRGAVATFAHGLAAAYVGFTVAFGSVAVRWADQRVSSRLGGSQPPSTSYPTRWESLMHELQLWMRCIAAVAIIYVLLFAGIYLVDEPAKTEALEIWFRIPLGTAFFWFLFGPLWTLVFFKRDPHRSTTLRSRRSDTAN